MSLLSYEIDNDGISTYKNYFNIEGNDIAAGDNVACDENFVYFIDNPSFYHSQGYLYVLSVDENGLPTSIYSIPSIWGTFYKIFKLGDFLYTINYYVHDQMREERIYRYSIAPDGVLTMLDYVDGSAWEAAGPIIDMCINSEGRIFVASGCFWFD